MSKVEFITEELVSVVEQKFRSLRKNDAYTELAHHVLDFLGFDNTLRSFYFAWKSRNVKNHTEALPDGTTLRQIQLALRLRVEGQEYGVRVTFQNIFYGWDHLAYSRLLELRQDYTGRNNDIIKRVTFDNMPTERTVFQTCRSLYLELKKHAKICLSCGVITLLPCDFCKDCVTVFGKTNCKKCGQCSGSMKNGFHKVCKKLFKKRSR